MGWRPVARKAYDCDGCGKTLKDPEFDMECTFPVEVSNLTDADEWLDEIGWHVVDLKAFCVDCWHWCEGPGTEVVGAAKHCHDAECKEARR